MQKSKVLIIFLILIFLTSCTNQVNNNITENEEKTYAYLDEIEEEYIQEYKDLNDEYIGKEVNYLLVNTESKEKINTGNTDKVKIIILYSPYCETCKLEAKFISQNFNNLNNIEIFMTAQEKNTNGEQIMKDNGYEMPLYYFGQDIPNEVYKLYNLGRPGYLVINEKNEIQFLTSGYLNQDTYKKIFEPIKDLFPENITGSDENNDTTICTLCE